MGLPDFSVKKPVTTVMFYLGVLLLGVISWVRLPQELYPPITYPQLTVVTFYKDAAPEEMEVLVTKPIEEAAGTVSGVRRISSASKEEISMVIAEFTWGTNMDFAALGVREKIDLIKESLPRGSEDPIVMKFNPFELPVAVLNITSENMPASELEQTCRNMIKNELEKANGVAACNLSGGITREILIEINQDRMMSKGIAITDIVEALNKANLNYPAGTVEEQFYEYLIRTMGEFKVVPEIKDVVVGIDDRTKKDRFPEYGQEDLKEKQERAIQDKRIIMLKEIAKIKDTFKEKTSISRYNQKDSISISIQKQAGTNTVQVANNIKEVLKRLKEMLHSSVKINIVYDQSTFIKGAISGVRDAALQGGILAFLVLYFFLRNFWSSFIVTLNIPISIVAVFALMYFSGITLNMISLGGLALGVGMLVDAGIVVIENIYRHRQEGKPPKEASVNGTNEVAGAIAGSVLTTIAVFLPTIFVIGVAGQLFKELSFTVTFSLLASWAVSLTVMPLFTSRERHIPKVEKTQEDTGILASMLYNMHRLNDRLLQIFLNHKTIGLAFAISLFLIVCFLLPKLDRELLPRLDQGQFIIKLDMPPGTKLETTDLIAKKIENKLFDFQEVKEVTVNIGSAKEKKGEQLLETMGANQGQIIVNLKPKTRFGKTGSQYRTNSTSYVVQKLKDSLGRENLLGANIDYILQESIFGGTFQAGKPIVIEVKGQDIERLKEITNEIKAGLKKIAGLYGIEDDLIPPSPEIKANIKKEKAANYNLSVSDIALTAQTAIKGYTATKFKEGGREIDVDVRLRKADRDQIEKIRRLTLHSPLGIDLPLAEVAYLTKGTGPTEIRRLDQQRTVLISAAILNRSFNAVSSEVEAMLKRTKIPRGYLAELTGEKEEMQESFTSLIFALMLSVLLVYMIMAAQFESLWQPIIIMFTIPLSLVGVVFVLLVTHTPINAMVILGVIVLGGIVVNNAIVLIDYVNMLRKEGLSVYDALVKASHTRLRPILMTSLTTIFGLIPLALGMGEGAELQRPMAITIMGGLAVSTFLSLVIIPTIYISFEEVKGHIKRTFFYVPYQKPAEVVLPVEPSPITLPPIETKPPTKPKPLIEPTPSIEQKPITEEKPKIEPKPKITPEPKVEPKPPQKPTPESEKGNIAQDIWDSLTARHKELIAYLNKNHRVTRKEYSDMLKISVPTAARDLKFLTDKNILEFKGPAGPGRYYILRKEV